MITSAGTFASIVTADSFGRSFEKTRNPEYTDEQQTLQQQIAAQKSTKERTYDWLQDNRYSVVFGSWVASMGTALGIVGRNPYLTGQQKLVQARVYAQGLTIAVVIISLAFETNDQSKGAGRWETVKILDPNDPTHKHVIEKKIHHEAYAGEDQWRDMIEAEEARLKNREAAVKKNAEKEHKKDPKHHKEKKDIDLERGEKPDEAVSNKLNAP